jgi:cellulose synthase/poly-beta-1,6-N-acetylglucosamine synthase-like glycosyltransferase
MSAVEAIFWLGVVWVGYVWIGYPVILAVVSIGRRFRAVTADDYYPMVSVLIAARNEQRDIGWKLVETLGWDYPEDRLEVLVGSDASSDGTDDAIRSVRDPRLTFVRNEERSGKNRTLNRLARIAKGELLFFTDANTHIEPQCLKKMVRYFADTRVGCVTGLEQNLEGDDTSTITMGSNAYLGYEATVDSLESKLGSVLVCDGSIYCLRRSLFFSLDPDLANDLEHPVRAGAARSTILYEPGARSFERCSSSAREEFTRRRRIAGQGALAMWRLRRELRGFRLWQFVSRKCLRWLTLIPVAMILISTFIMRRNGWFEGLFAAQIAFCLITILGAWQGRQSRISAVLRLPFVAVMANVAVFLGVVDAICGKTFATWNIAELSRGTGKASS